MTGDGHDPIADPSELGLGHERVSAPRLRGRTAAIFGICVAAAVVAALIALVLLDDPRGGAPGPDWERVDGPPTSVGGATLWTTCRNRERLWLTLGADGFPAGPVTIDPSVC